MTVTTVANKERPILFSGEMVRAILEGRKTQARRIMKPQPVQVGRVWSWKTCSWTDTGRILVGTLDTPLDICPYGQPGDRLWVKETFSRCGCDGCLSVWPKFNDHKVRYREGYGGPSGIVFRPSIFMPRWASRITLEIVSVRVERVREINESDARAEGFEKEFRTVVMRPDGGPNYHIPLSHRGGFVNGWERRNAKRGYGWDSNPWVWVIEFKRLEAK
ncbi:MAG TPA: hypothetical protein VJW77_04210 [Terriglobia bacterium]|nr:hypothetical protein [Terriglobia bacterium]